MSCYKIRMLELELSVIVVKMHIQPNSLVYRLFVKSRISFFFSLFQVFKGKKNIIKNKLNCRSLAIAN